MADENKSNNKMRLQLVLSTIVAVFGLLMIIASFIVPPTGVIDNSVLVAVGEVFTFSGSLAGVDYHYRYKISLNNNSSFSSNEGQ